MRRPVYCELYRQLMTHHPARDILLGCLIVTMVCGSFAGLTSCDSAPAPAIPSETFRRVIASFCSYAIDCPNRPAGFTFDTQSECQDIMLNSIGGSVAMGQYDTAAENGRIIWSNDDGEYCAELAAAWAASATCQQLWATRITLNYSDPRCDELGHGTVALGDACAVSLECADDNSCRSGKCEP